MIFFSWSSLKGPRCEQSLVRDRAGPKNIFQTSWWGVIWSISKRSLLISLWTSCSNQPENAHPWRENLFVNRKKEEIYKDKSLDISREGFDIDGNKMLEWEKTMADSRGWVLRDFTTQTKVYLEHWLPSFHCEVTFLVEEKGAVSLKPQTPYTGDRTKGRERQQNTCTAKNFKRAATVSQFISQIRRATVERRNSRNRKMKTYRKQDLCFHWDCRLKTWPISAQAKIQRKYWEGPKTLNLTVWVRVSPIKSPKPLFLEPTLWYSHIEQPLAIYTQCLCG